MSRRTLLRGLGVAVLGAGLPALIRSRGVDAFDRASDLFSLGVASGDPTAHSVVLWTRLAPDPLNGGGMPDEPYSVEWEVATDPEMVDVIRRGVRVALPRDGHAVHVVANGLPPGQWLFYRFRALGAYSRVGRSRTFPGLDARVERMRFALASCQNYNHGFFTAYADMLTQDLDFVVHVGDYIYEGGPASYPIAPGRTHRGSTIRSIQDYRDRYALYRLDRDLQDAHAAYPFIVTPDDHEIDNNYAGLTPDPGSPSQGESFIERRRIAYQVYSEMMPLRPENRYDPTRDVARFHRRLQFGTLANLHLLDTRQYRTDQPAGDWLGSTDPRSLALESAVDGTVYDPDGIRDPGATLLGSEQEAWLEGNLRASNATWNVIAQQIMVMPWNLVGAVRRQVDRKTSMGEGKRAHLLGVLDHVENLYNVDAWDGYQAARGRLLDMLAEVRPANPVILSGDIHSAWAAELTAEMGTRGGSDLLAVELVATSIASCFFAMDPRPSDDEVRHSLIDNPHIRYFNGLFRGYVCCELDEERLQASYRAVGRAADVGASDPLALVPREDSPVATDAVLGIRAGFNAPGGQQILEGWSRFAAAGILEID